MKKIAKKATNKALGKLGYRIQATETIVPEQWLELLKSQPEIAKDGTHRIAMTVGCRDADYIPKVRSAGTIKKIDGKEYQLMHNGVLVEAGGYFGDWMSEVIVKLKGHHEPQEEKVFYELLKKVPTGGTMIELGSFWSYYSLWFNSAIKNATNYCCEPNPVNLELGKRNAAINKAKNMNFILAAAGKDDGKELSFQSQEDETRPPDVVPIRSIDSIMAEHKIKRFDIVHMDVQGAELDALRGAEKAIKHGKIRFVIVSTHHYLVSEDTRLHEKSLDFITSHGGHIIAEHAIHESFSGDGLIVASFDKADKNLSIEISENRMNDMLFRTYTRDMEILIDAYEKLRARS
jgi:FkbM family methyltransferase